MEFPCVFHDMQGPQVPSSRGPCAGDRDSKMSVESFDDEPPECRKDVQEKVTFCGGYKMLYAYPQLYRYTMNTQKIHRHTILKTKNLGQLIGRSQVIEVHAQYSSSLSRSNKDPIKFQSPALDLSQLFQHARRAFFQRELRYDNLGRRGTDLEEWVCLQKIEGVVPSFDSEKKRIHCVQYLWMRLEDGICGSTSLIMQGGIIGF